MPWHNPHSSLTSLTHTHSPTCLQHSDRFGCIFPTPPHCLCLTNPPHPQNTRATSSSTFTSLLAASDRVTWTCFVGGKGVKRVCACVCGAFQLLSVVILPFVRLCPLNNRGRNVCKPGGKCFLSLLALSSSSLQIWWLCNGATLMRGHAHISNNH